MMQNLLTEHTFDTGTAKLNFAEGPKCGPPLLLLHGFSNNWKEFLPLVNGMSRRWHLIAPDFRGHGKSQHTAGHYNIEECAADIIALIQQVFTEPPVIIGHSLGGMVGIMVAARMGERVRGLVVGDAPLYHDTLDALAQEFSAWSNTMMRLARAQPSLKKLVAALPKVMPGKESTWYQYKAESCTQLDPEIFTSVETALRGFDCESLLPQVTCPVLLLQANAMTDSDVRRALSQLSQASVVRLKCVGHDLHLGKKAYFVIRAIARFLESFESEEVLASA